MIATPIADPARTIEVSRLINAPRTLVFKMFTQAAHIDAWWGPEGFRNETHEMGFFNGGLWHYTMHGPDGKAWPNWIKYKSITPPALITYDHGAEMGEPAHFQGTITLEEQGDKTLVTLTLVFPTAEARDATIKFGAIEGGQQTLARLDSYAVDQTSTSKAALEDKPFIISRTFNAPRELLFDCFTNPERMKHWLGPKGVKVITAKMDLRPGGMYHYAMQAEGAPAMWGKSAYREVTPPKRLIYINSFSDENAGLTRHPGAPDWPIELLTTITFEADGNKTNLTIKWELMDNVTASERAIFLTSFGSMTMGWGGSLDKLGEYLETA
jgi:uncharacterized protein YndB with AHSA1/START domain